MLSLRKLEDNQDFISSWQSEREDGGKEESGLELGGISITAKLNIEFPKDVTKTQMVDNKPK